MKIRPILFGTPMVQAILEDRKTQTRRIIKPQPTEGTYNKLIYAGQELTLNAFRNYAKYQVGDILWVREGFCVAKNWDHWNPASLPEGVDFNYKADCNDDYIPKFLHRGRWRPSIHMPKIACRIFLKVTNVRVERLQDISEEDIKAEGVKVEPDFVLGEKNSPVSFLPDGCFANGGKPSVKQIFFAHWASLWAKINGKESWEANPWVWVYDFKRVEKPENF